MVEINRNNGNTKYRKRMLSERDNKLRKIESFDKLLDISLNTFNGKYPLLSCVDTFINDKNVDLDSLIDENTKELNNDGKLIYKMNENGFLTLNSQSGLIYKDNKQRVIKQRSYISGIIDISLAHKLHKKINNEYDNLICIYIDNSTTENIQGIPVTYIDNNPITHVHLNSEYNNIEHLFNVDFQNQLLNDYVTIHFIDMTFGKKSSEIGGLFTKINDILEEIISY